MEAGESTFEELEIELETDADEEFEAESSFKELEIELETDEDEEFEAERDSEVRATLEETEAFGRSGEEKDAECGLDTPTVGAEAGDKWSAICAGSMVTGEENSSNPTRMMACSVWLRCRIVQGEWWSANFQTSWGQIQFSMNDVNIAMRFQISNFGVSIVETRRLQEEKDCIDIRVSPLHECSSVSQSNRNGKRTLRVLQCAEDATDWSPAPAGGSDRL